MKLICTHLYSWQMFTLGKCVGSVMYLSTYINSSSINWIKCTFRFRFSTDTRRVHNFSDTTFLVCITNKGVYSLEMCEGQCVSYFIFHVSELSENAMHCTRSRSCKCSGKLITCGIKAFKLSDSLLIQRLWIIESKKRIEISVDRDQTLELWSCGLVCRSIQL